MGLTEVKWSLHTGDTPSREALQALELAQNAAQDFDQAFELRNEDREAAIPCFHGDEIIMSAQAIRFYTYLAEHELRTVRIIMDLQKGSFGTKAQQARSRFADRSIDGHYAVKFLQNGLMDSEHACNAATEMILETKILMNLAPHPNISQVYGVNSVGIDSFLKTGRKSFFIVTDRIAETLTERIQHWKHQETNENTDSAPSAALASSLSSLTLSPERERLNARLEIAMDIASALVYLHSRRLVFYFRPDKVGFDTRYGRIKLLQFGQARQEGMTAHAKSLTKSDNMQYLAYTAPEVFCMGPTTTATDVYAFGVLLWEMMSLEQPFEGWDRAAHFQRAVRANERLEIPMQTSRGRCWPDAICELVKNCWDPHLRPTMKMAHDSLEMALLFEEEDEDKVKEEFRELRQRKSKEETEIKETSTGSGSDQTSTESPEPSRGVSRHQSDTSGLKKLVLKGKPRRRKSSQDDESTGYDTFCSQSAADREKDSSAKPHRKNKPDSFRGRRVSPEATRRRKKKSPSNRGERGASPDPSTATATTAASTSRRPGKKRTESGPLRASEEIVTALSSILRTDASGKTRRIPVRSTSGDFDGNNSLPLMETTFDVQIEKPRPPLTPPARRKASSRDRTGPTSGRPKPRTDVQLKTPRRRTSQEGLKPANQARSQRRRQSADASDESPVTTPTNKQRRRHSTDVCASPPTSPLLRSPRRHSVDVTIGSPDKTPIQTPVRPRRRQRSLTLKAQGLTPRGGPRGSVPSTPRGGGSGRGPGLITPRAAGRGSVPSTPRTMARRNNSDSKLRLRRKGSEKSVERSVSEDNILDNLISDDALASAVGNLAVSPTGKVPTEEEKRADLIAGIVGNISL